MHTFLIGTAFELFQLPFKPFILCEEGAIRKVSIEDAHRVRGIHRCQQLVACVTDGLEVPWGNVTCRTDDGEVFQQEVFI